MISSKIRLHIKALELRTRKILQGFSSGENYSALRGSGYEFDQIRPYEQGDDLRFIDWKSSARSNKFLCKQYFDDKNRDVVICVDVSSSIAYSTSVNDKQFIINQVAAVLALVCEHARDTVTLILFSDKIDLVLFRGLGVNHTASIMDALFSFEIKENTGTNFKNLFKYLDKNGFKNSFILMISDFISKDINQKDLNVLSLFNQVVAIQCLDKMEKSFGGFGLLNLKDIETGETLFLDTKSIDNSFDIDFKKAGIAHLKLDLDSDILPPLISFFNKNMVL